MLKNTPMPNSLHLSPLPPLAGPRPRSVGRLPGLVGHSRLSCLLIVTAMAAWLCPAAVTVGSDAGGEAGKEAAGVADDIAGWPLPRADAQSTGAVANSLPDQLEVLWEYQAEEAIETTPVVAAGRVFAADVMGQVYAVRLKDGQELWKRDFDTGFNASPAVAGSLVVAVDVEGNVYGLDAETGEERWRQTTEGEIDAAAAFYQHLVLVTSQDGKLYAFAADDGKPAWTYQTDDQIRCSPTIAGSQTFLGGCDGQLHRVDLNTGKAIGKPLTLGGPTGSTPAVVGNQAFVPIMDGAVLAFDWEAGETMWRYEDLERQQEYRGSAAIAGPLVIVTSRNKFVDAISRETGKRVWRHTLRRRADASPIVAGDDVWIAATDGRLIRLALATGEEKWQYEIRGAFAASPAIAGDRLIVADDQGVIRAFGAASR